MKKQITKKHALGLRIVGRQESLKKAKHRLFYWVKNGRLVSIVVSNLDIP